VGAFSVLGVSSARPEPSGVWAGRFGAYGGMLAAVAGGAMTPLAFERFDLAVARCELDCAHRVFQCPPVALDPPTSAQRYPRPPRAAWGCAMTSSPVAQARNEIRARLEVVASNLLHIAQGSGRFVDANDIYMQLAVAITRLDLCQREMLRHNMLSGP
jgi:hypothetical protein